MFVDSKSIFQDRYFGDIDALFGVDICNQPHLDFAHAFAFAPLVMNLVTLRRVCVLPVSPHQATKEEFEAKQRV